MKLTIASKVTILRICLIPLFILSYYFFSGPGVRVIPTVIFVVAAVTDWVDGYLARSRNEVTNFGKFIDPSRTSSWSLPPSSSSSATAA